MAVLILFVYLHYQSLQLVKQYLTLLSKQKVLHNNIQTKSINVF